METILKAYAVTGAVVAIGAGTVFFFSRVDPGLLDVLMSEPTLLLAISGLVLSGASILAMRVLVHRRTGLIKQSDSQAAASFIELWTTFEAEAVVALENRGVPFNTHSTPSIIDSLISCEIIDYDDRPRLDWLLNVRNSIVHGQGTPDGDASYALLILSELTHRVVSSRTA